MTPSPPLVSVGLPVRNGANYLSEALDSAMGQTLRNFELIVSDNASNDDTVEIVRSVERHDHRVRLIQQVTNVGAAENYNVVFRQARGQYFCWLAHDDYWAPDYLERCVAVLDSTPEAVLCFSDFAEVDSERRIHEQSSRRTDLESEATHLRFRDVLRRSPVPPIFGLMRTDVLRRTTLMQPRMGHDRVVLAELALHGPFRQLPDTLFFSRHHPDQYSGATASNRERLRWWLPEGGRRTVVLPKWTRLLDYAKAVRRVPLPTDARRRCWTELAEFALWEWRPLVRELGAAGRGLVSR